MGSVHFIGGEKGGVGKSFTARLLAQYFIDKGIPFQGFDSDRSHETFSRFYGQFSEHLDVNDFSSLDQLAEFAESNPDHALLVDLAAQTFTGLAKWFADSDGFGLFDELGVEVYLWHVMDDGADSMFLLDKLLKTFADDRFKLMVVRNGGRGGKFDQFNASPVYQKAINRGAQFLDLAELQATLMQKVDFNSLSFWAAANNRQVMSITERKRAATWLKRHYELIDELLTSPVNAAADEGLSVDSQQVLGSAVTE